MLLYGFRLRGIDAHAHDKAAGSADRWAILVDPAQAERALASVESVWAAILDTDSARTPDGRCVFCGYDLSGIPDTPGGNLICPECGVNLRSIEARRAWREGRRPRQG